MMQKAILHTPRLYLRVFSPLDAANFYALNQDEEVLRYTGDLPFKNEAEAQQFLVQYNQYQLYGFGRWAVIRQSDESYLGWCGLKYSPDLEEIDLGFRFFRKYWNQGYATESARACLEYGLRDIGIKEIIGRARKDNKASVRVLEKIGMQFKEQRLMDERQWLVYSSC